MENRTVQRICLVVAVLGVPALSTGQELAPAARFVDPASIRAQSLTPAQLTDLVAPIALYPDALLSQVLVASTYPLEVVQAQQWLERNGRLRGQELMDAARQQPWDASVQGLVAFPDALATLNEDIQWTTDLGNAFLAQESDVMAAVQELRNDARAAGRLASTSQQTVSAVAQEGRTVIEIVPADPQVVYVPQYDPYYVWGAPAWSAYPPLSYGYGYGFGAGVHVGFWFGGWSWGWGWGWGPNWYGGSVYVNSAFFRHCGYDYGHHGGHYGSHYGGHNDGHYRGHGGRETWKHDAGHRQGVPYHHGRGAGADRGGSKAARSTLTSPGSSRRSQSPLASSSGDRARSSGSRGAGPDDGWRSGNRTAASGARGAVADQPRRSGNRTAAPGLRAAGTDPGWRTGDRTIASGSRGGGPDRGWSTSGEQGRRSTGTSQGREPSARSASPSWRSPSSSPRSSSSSPRGWASSPRYSNSSPRSSASSPGYPAPPRSYSASAPQRSYSSSAPSRSYSPSASSRGFPSAPRGTSPGGAGRSVGDGGSQRSGGIGGPRGTGGGMRSGGGLRSGGGSPGGGGGRRH